MLDKDYQTSALHAVPPGNKLVDKLKCKVVLSTWIDRKFWITRAVIPLKTRVLDKHIHPAHTFYDIMLQMTRYALNEKHNEYA